MENILINKNENAQSADNNKWNSLVDDKEQNSFHDLVERMATDDYTPEDMDRYANELLKLIRVSSEEAEQPVGQLLYHLIVAVVMFEHMGSEERNYIALMLKRLKSFFSVKFVLKEGKRKKEKENLSSTSPLEYRQEAFRQQCLSFLGKVDTQRLTDFYNFWSEENVKAGKMRSNMRKHGIPSTASNSGCLQVFLLTTPPPRSA